MSSETTTAARIRTGPHRSAATLDGFALAATRADGVVLRELGVLDCLHIRTRNSWYRLVVLDPQQSRVLISGGAFFTVPVEATMSGASIGGSMLKLGCILRGFHFEVLHGGMRIVTTAVREILVNDPDAVPGPF